MLRHYRRFRGFREELKAKSIIYAVPSFSTRNAILYDGYVDLKQSWRHRTGDCH